VRIGTLVVAAVSPVQVALVAVGVALLVFASVDLWRNHGYSTADKVGWQLVVGGLSLGPLVSLGDGWFLSFPLGALAYLLLAKHGPVRRRSTTEATVGADRPTTVGGTDR
jgi:hypothetical protein